MIFGSVLVLIGGGLKNCDKFVCLGMLIVIWFL